MYSWNGLANFAENLRKIQNLPKNLKSVESKFSIEFQLKTWNLKNIAYSWDGLTKQTLQFFEKAQKLENLPNQMSPLKTKSSNTAIETLQNQIERDLKGLAWRKTALGNRSECCRRERSIVLGFPWPISLEDRTATAPLRNSRLADSRYGSREPSFAGLRSAGIVADDACSAPETYFFESPWQCQPPLLFSAILSPCVTSMPASRGLTVMHLHAEDLPTPSISIWNNGNRDEWSAEKLTVRSIDAWNSNSKQDKCPQTVLKDSVAKISYD